MRVRHVDTAAAGGDVDWGEDGGRILDWDKVRIFFTVAEAGSFTRAGEDLGLSQSAVSRQISALERELHAPLFHRHARGLLLTEQGDLLFRAARDMKMRLESTRARLSETSERPSGTLKVTTTVGLGSLWLTQRIPEFMDLYPDISVEMLLSNEELDLAMREADVAIRLRQPTQPDLIQRRLFTVHFHVYASPDYIKRFGEPKALEELDDHRLLAFGGDQPSYLLGVHWLATAGRDLRNPRPYRCVINNISGLKTAVENGAGIAVLPDYVTDQNNQLVQVLRDIEMPALESYLVYAEEMRSVARVQVFRDFLVSKAQRWTY
ncbi:MAG: LysR family transcriptional regulator [Saliniramus fredricksonii]|uniref:LysR family transcriptional regulator n=1 Tax=Saliniramus fredricksonii TaxID=1653334 RepID=A0A0P7Y032_9HYPH|nr:MAG: LysR family transcriptional regulator [Saliniramus fredricksonii]